MSKKLIYRPLFNGQTDKFIDYTDMVAKHSSRLLTGNGALFTHPEKREWCSEFANKNELDMFLNHLAYNLSIKGSQIVGFDKYGEDDIRLFMVADNQLNRLQKRYNEIIAAIIGKRVNTQNPEVFYNIREQGTKKEIKREYYYNEKRLQLAEVINMVPAEDILPEREVNTFGVIPFMDFINLPFDNKADILPTNQYPDILNRMRRMMFSEAQKNQTRIFIDTTNNEQKGKIENAIKEGQFNDYIIDMKDRDTTGKVAMANIQGDAKLLIFQEAIERMEKQFFSSVGYSYNAVIEGATATEIAISNSVDAKTTNLKRAIFNNKMTYLLELLRAVLKLTEPFLFELNDNVSTDKTAEVALVREQMTLGLITKARAIAQLNNIDLEEAEERVKELNAEIKADNDLFQPQQPNNQFNNQNKEPMIGTEGDENEPKPTG